MKVNTIRVIQPTEKLILIGDLPGAMDMDLERGEVSASSDSDWL